MKAAVLRSVGSLQIETLMLDGPRAEEIRIRVMASGLCHSDYHFITGDLPMMMPALLGHEAAGVVEAIGEDVVGIAPGDFVVTCVSAYCGACRECQCGHNHRCEQRPGLALDRPSKSRLTDSDGNPVYQFANLGAFAEEMVVHHRAVVKISEAVPPAAAALLGCGVLTGIGSVLNAAKVPAGSTVAVIGCGGVGLNVIQGARIAGAERIIAIDLSTAKLDLARTFGATDTVVGGPEAVAQVLEMTSGGVDFAFEAIGLPQTMHDSCAMLRSGGTATLLGVASAGANLAIPVMMFAAKEIRVIGSKMGSSPFQILLPQLAQFYLRGELMLDELVSQCISLDEINEGYARVATGNVARNVIVF